MLNTYKVILNNYNTDTDRTITVKAPTYDGARKLAELKTNTGEYIRNVKDASKPDPDDYENREHCKRIAEDLEDYHNGNVRICPECGELHCRDWDEVGDVFKCPACGAVTDTEDWETESLWSYFNDALDVEYRVNRDKEYKSVEILVTFGGPNIYISTETCSVNLYWWGDTASYPIAREVIEEIDAIWEDYFNCI